MMDDTDSILAQNHHQRRAGLQNRHNIPVTQIERRLGHMVYDNRLASPFYNVYTCTVYSVHDIFLKQLLLRVAFG